MGRMDLFALAVQLTALFLMDRRSRSSLLVRLRGSNNPLTGSQAFLGGGTDLLGLGLVLCLSLPDTGAPPHQFGTIGFSHIPAFRKQIDDRDIPAIIVDLDFS